MWLFTNNEINRKYEKIPANTHKLFFSKDDPVKNSHQLKKEGKGENMKI